MTSEAPYPDGHDHVATTSTSAPVDAARSATQSRAAAAASDPSNPTTNRWTRCVAACGMPTPSRRVVPPGSASHTREGSPGHPGQLVLTWDLPSVVGPPGVVREHRDLPDDRGPARLGLDHLEGAVEALGPLAHVGQSEAPAGRWPAPEATAVVGDLHPALVPDDRQPDPGPGGAGVATDVGQRLPQRGQQLVGDRAAHRGVDRSVEFDRDVEADHRPQLFGQGRYAGPDALATTPAELEDGGPDLADGLVNVGDCGSEAIGHVRTGMARRQSLE